MPLSVGKIALESALAEIYGDVGAYKNVSEFAKRKAQAIYDFAKTGIPMTILTNEPGSVSGAMTAGPVKATGLGGFDKPVPGMGLAAAKPLLMTEFIALWSHGNSVTTAKIFAKKHATAVFNYYSQAMILTKDESAGPLPAPPPAGPVTGPMTGIGGDLTDSPGMGFDAAKPILEAEIKRIWSQIGNAPPAAVPKLAKELSEAIHNFCIQGKVNTTGVIIAPAAVAPPPAPPSGAYMVGTGTAQGTIS